MAYDAELADRLRELVEATAGSGRVTEKKMFGGLGFMVEGHMAVAASARGGLLVRCAPEDTEALIASAPRRARPFEMRGKPMDGWLRVDVEVTDEDVPRWVEVGLGYVCTLPPKE